MEASQVIGRLYVVGTPIGNLGDMSPRAVETLQNADLIAAEDTRTAASLLEKFGITGAKIVPNHKFNEQAAADGFVRDLLAGKNLALVTDAGMPCISDPGYLLVESAVAAGVSVTVVPGACAAVSAVAVSGFNALSFAFYGFLPRSAGDIRKVLRRIEKEYSPLSVFYESPNRIVDTVELVAEVLSGCQICVCNDLTKLYERIYRGTPAEVLAELKANPNAAKGEYVLIIYREKTEEPSEERLSYEAMLVDCMVKNGISSKEAVSLLASSKAAPKRELYDAAVRLKEIL